MNWDQIQGRWDQFRGPVKERWGRLTEDDLDEIGGRREELVGHLRERYGLAREQAEYAVEEWMRPLRGMS